MWDQGGGSVLEVLDHRQDGLREAFCWTWRAAGWHLEPLSMFGNLPALGVWVDETERGS